MAEVNYSPACRSGTTGKRLGIQGIEKHRSCDADALEQAARSCGSEVLPTCRELRPPTCPARVASTPPVACTIRRPDLQGALFAAPYFRSQLGFLPMLYGALDARRSKPIRSLSQVLRGSSQERPRLDSPAAPRNPSGFLTLSTPLNAPGTGHQRTESDSLPMRAFIGYVPRAPAPLSSLSILRGEGVYERY